MTIGFLPSKGKRVGANEWSAWCVKRVERMVCEEIGDATADQSGVLAQAWALPAGSRPEGRVSIRSSIGGDGIMMYQS